MMEKRMNRIPYIVRVFALLLAFLMIATFLPDMGIVAPKPLQAKAATTHNINTGGPLVINPGSGDYYISGNGAVTANTINIKNGYRGTITLDSVVIYSKEDFAPIRVHGNGTATSVWTVENNSNKNPTTKVNIVLKGANRLNSGLTETIDSVASGLQVDQGAQIHISAIDPLDNTSGSIHATTRNTNSSVAGGAGIGGGCVQRTNGDGASTGTFSGNYFRSGTTSTSGTGRRITGGNIIISSGTVDAQGGMCGAGIGGGGWQGLYMGSIIITGGVVKSVGGVHSPGIGGGCDNGAGNVGSYVEGTSVIAIPPAEITATTPAGKGLSGAADIVYLGDPESPEIKVYTAGIKEKEANIYFDLSEYAVIANAFATLYPEYPLTKINIGKTDITSGQLVLRATLKENTTFFTDASSTQASTWGRPFMPVVTTVIAAKNIELPLLDLKIELTDIPSTPIEKGYAAALAASNAHRVRVKYTDTKQLTNVEYEVQLEGGKTDFTDLKFFKADGTTPMIKPTTLKNGDEFVIAVPAKQGLDANIYRGVMRFNGKIVGGTETGWIRRVVTQRVTVKDSNNDYIKVTANPVKFESNTNAKSTTLGLNINHGSHDFKFDPSEIDAKYYISTEKTYAAAALAKPVGSWTNMTKPTTEGATVNTNAAFTGMADGTYYIHWNVVSGVIEAQSKDYTTTAPTYGAFGPYIIDSVAPTATLTVDGKTTDFDIATPKNELPVSVTFSEVATIDTTKLVVTNATWSIPLALKAGSTTVYEGKLKPIPNLGNGEKITITAQAGLGKDSVGNLSAALTARTITLKATAQPTITINSDEYYSTLTPTFTIDASSGDNAINDNTDLSKAAAFTAIPNGTLSGIVEIKKGGTVVPAANYTVNYATGDPNKMTVTFTGKLENSSEYTVNIAASRLFNKLKNPNILTSKSFKVAMPDFSVGSSMTANPEYLESAGGASKITVKGGGLKINSDNNRLQVRITATSAQGKSVDSGWFKGSFTTSGGVDTLVYDATLLANTAGTYDTYTFKFEYNLNATGATDSGLSCKVYINPPADKLMTIALDSTAVVDMEYKYTAANALASKQVVTVTNNSSKPITATTSFSATASDFKKSKDSITIPINGSISFDVYLDQNKVAGSYNDIIKVSSTTPAASASAPLKEQKVVANTTSGTTTDAWVVGAPEPNNTAWRNQRPLTLTPKTKSDDSVLSWRYAVTESISSPSSWTDVSSANAANHSFPADIEKTYYVHFIVNTKNFTGITGIVKVTSGTDNKYNVDTLAPSVLSMTSSVATAGKGDFTVTAEFSEAATTQDIATKLSLTNATAGAIAEVTGSAKTKYTIKLTPTGGGDISVKLNTGAITDRAGNPSKESTALVVPYDSTAPSITYDKQDIYSVLRPNFKIKLKANDPTSNLDLYGSIGGVNKLLDNANFTSLVVIKNSTVATATPSYAATYRTDPSGEHYINVVFTADVKNDCEYAVSIAGKTVYNLSGNPNEASNTTFIVSKADFKSDPTATITIAPTSYTSSGGTGTITITGSGMYHNVSGGKLTLRVAGSGDGITYNKTVALSEITKGNPATGVLDKAVLTVAIPTNTTGSANTHTFNLYWAYGAPEEDTGKSCQVTVDPSASAMLNVTNNSSAVTDLTYGYTLAQTEGSQQVISVKNNSSQTITGVSATITNSSGTVVFKTKGTLSTSISAGATQSVPVHLLMGQAAGDYGVGHSVTIRATTALSESVTASVALVNQKVKPKDGGGVTPGTFSATATPPPNADWKNYSQTIVTLTPTADSGAVKKFWYRLNAGDSWAELPVASDKVTVPFPTNSDTTYTLEWKVDTNNYTGILGTIDNGGGVTSYKIDRIVPTVQSIVSSVSAAGKADFEVTVTFSEDVTGFSHTGMTVTGGTATAFTLVSPTVYKVTIRPGSLSAGGVIRFGVKAGAATDKAGNPNPVYNAKVGEDVPFTSDRPTVSFGFNGKGEGGSNKFLADQTSFTIKLDAHGKDNQSIFKGGVLPNGSLAMTGTVEISRTNPGGAVTSLAATYQANATGGEITVNGDFTDGAYTVRFIENSLSNDSGNGVVGAVGQFEVRNVTVTSVALKTNHPTNPAELEYSGGTATITIEGTNLQHITTGDLKLTPTQPTGAAITSFGYESSGTKATYIATIPANTLDSDVVYKWTASHKGGFTGNVELTIKAAEGQLDPTQGFDVNPKTHEPEGGKSTATIKGVNLHNLANLRVVVEVPGAAPKTITVPTVVTAGEQTASVITEHPGNDSAVARTDTVKLYHDKGAPNTLAGTVDVVVEPSVPVIGRFYANCKESGDVKALTLGNEGDTVLFGVIGQNLNNFAPMTITSNVDTAQVPLMVLEKTVSCKSATVKVVVPSNPTAHDVVHDVTLHYTDQGDNGIVKQYPRQLQITVEGSYPKVESITVDQTKLTAAGGSVTATIKGRFLDNFTNIEVVNHYNGDIVVVDPTTVSADRTTITGVVLTIPPWDNTNLRNDIHRLEVTNEFGPTGVTTEVEVGDSLPNMQTASAKPNHYATVADTLGGKGRSTITIHGNYLFNYGSIEIYDETLEKYYTVTNKGDMTASYQVSVPSAIGIYTYHIFAEGNDMGISTKIGVGGAPPTLGDSGDEDNGDDWNWEDPDPGDGREDKPTEDKFWKGTGGGSKGRGHGDDSGGFYGFDVLEYQSRVFSMVDPKNPVVIVPNMFFITRAQIDRAATAAKEGARKSSKTGEGKLSLIFDTTLEGDATKLEGRLYLDADKPTPDIHTGVFVVEEEIKDTVKLVGEKYSLGDKQFSVISLGQNGSYGLHEVEIAALVDLKEMDEESLNFYLYDRKTEEFYVLDETKDVVDEAGFLHFYTKVGGDIIVTNEKLPITAKPTTETAKPKTETAKPKTETADTKE